MTMTRIAELIQEWTGWCPNAHVRTTKSSANSLMDFPAANPPVKNPGPSGEGGSGRPWDGLYEHTQRGSLIIGAVAAAIFLILATMYFFGPVLITVIVLAIMLFLLTICSTLTVSADADALRIRFGPVGLIRKRWPMSDVESVTAVTNPWYYGWGIRVTPHGLLYNVSGYGAVEVRLFSGKTFRIGTDEPEALKHAIEQAQKSAGKLRVV